MWTTGQSDQRQSRLGSVFDEPSEPYEVGGLIVRPFSMNAFRRAETLGLAIVAMGFEEAKKQFPYARILAEIDLLYWLLCSPLDGVRAAFRSNRVVAASKPCSVPLRELGAFAAEMDRVISLAQDCLFDIDIRDLDGAGEKEDEPLDLLTPGLMSSMVLLITEKMNVSEDFAAEWLPFCRVLQYAHVVQWSNPQVWTIAPSNSDPAEDEYGEAPPLDEGFGEPLAF